MGAMCAAGRLHSRLASAPTPAGSWPRPRAAPLPPLRTAPFPTTAKFVTVGDSKEAAPSATFSFMRALSSPVGGLWAISRLSGPIYTGSKTAPLDMALTLMVIDPIGRGDEFSSISPPSAALEQEHLASRRVQCAFGSSSVHLSAQTAVLVTTVHARLACIAAADLPCVAGPGPDHLLPSPAACGLDEGIAHAASVAQYWQRLLQQLKVECGGDYSSLDVASLPPSLQKRAQFFRDRQNSAADRLAALPTKDQAALLHSREVKVACRIRSKGLALVKQLQSQAAATSVSGSGGSGAGAAADTAADSAGDNSACAASAASGQDAHRCCCAGLCKVPSCFTTSSCKGRKAAVATIKRHMGNDFCKLYIRHSLRRGLARAV